MELTVLGKSPSWQDRGGACTGYLVQASRYALLLDCGSGVFGRLRDALDYVDVDAIVISHMHADHVLDLIPFASALSYSPRREAKAWVRPALHLPPGGVGVLRSVAGAFVSDDLIERAFATSEYEPDEELSLGPLAARFCEVPHFIQAFAVALSEPDGRRLTFGADCRANEQLATFAADTDLLIVEASAPPGPPPPKPDEPRGHMTPREAGELGRRARARRLLVSHFSDEVDEDAVRAEAAAGFGAGVELARSGARLVV